MAHDHATRAEARAMYVEDGQSLDHIAEELGVNRNTVGRWKAEDDWDDARRQYRHDMRSIRSSTLAARKKLAMQVAAEPDPQLIYALCRLESVAMRKDKTTEAAAPDIDRPRLFLEDLEFIAAALKEIDPEGLKVLARNFDTIVKRFKAGQER